MLKTALSTNINLLKNVIPLQQQIRTTFILKRRYEPLLHKKGYNPKKLRAKHFIYDLVEDTTIKKKPNLEVVLKTFVEGVGDKGDVVSMRPTYVYNKLLLPGLAVYKTEENLKEYAKTDSEKKEVLHSSPFAQRTVNMLEGMTLAVIMNKDHPWEIKPWHIRASLRKAGYYVKEECITMPEQAITGPDLKKESKDFYCTITINNLEKARLRCRIHHWSTDPSERLPYVAEHWKLDAEPLFGNPKEPKEDTNKLEK